MRNLSFVTFLLGLSILVMILFFSQPIKFTSEEDFKNLQSNQKLLVRGLIIKETYNSQNKILTLDNDLKLTCSLPCPILLNKNISAIVRLEKFNNVNHLKILKLSYK